MCSGIDEKLRSWMIPEEEITITGEVQQGIHGDSTIGEVVGTNGCVMIKCLLDFKDPSRKAQYMKKVARIADMHWETIVPLVGFVRYGESLCIVTRFSARGSLEGVLEKRQREKGRPIGFGDVQIACVCYGIAMGMFLLHERGMVHGSLKPANVLLTVDYTPLLSDFLQEDLVMKRELTAADALYAAPETTESPPSEKSDVYSFGVLLLMLYQPEMDDDKNLDFRDPEAVHHAIQSRLVFCKPGNVSDESWNLLWKCLDKDPSERPDFSKILEILETMPQFPEPSRKAVQYKRYVRQLKHAVDPLDCRESHSQEKQFLFRAKSYKDALAQLSHVVVSSHSAVTEIHRKISEARFECRYCDSCYKLKRNDESGEWEAYQIGQHEGHETKAGKPIRQYLKDCIAEGLGIGHSGVKLIDYVRNVTKIDIPASTIYYYLLENPRKDWQKMWKQVPALGHRLRAADLRYKEYYSKEEDTLLESIAFELPGVKICSTDAFIGLVFVDGCFMNDRLRSTLLAAVTITADHVLVPLFGMICNGEEKIAYKRLFSFAKASLPKTVTFMSDQNKGIRGAFKHVFGASKDVKLLPCMFYVCQGMSDALRSEIKDILVCDHLEVYNVMKEIFSREHRAVYDKHSEKLELMSFMSNKFSGIFEFIADSPIESLNSAIKKERSLEPVQVMEGLIHFTKKQIEHQTELLMGANTYCQACTNTIERRKEQGQNLACRKETRNYFVHETFCVGVSVEYKVQILNGKLSCSCEGYERLGIPCRHIYAVYNKYFETHSMLPEIKSMHCVQTIEQALKQMNVDVNTLNLEEIEVSHCAPKRRPGRPRKKRYRALREYLPVNKNIHCGACGKEGHTRRSHLCPARIPTQNKQSRRKRKESFRERVGQILLARRSQSQEVLSTPISLSDSFSDEEELAEIEEEILEDKYKAREALGSGSADFFETFANW